jgi:hypothetical protein
MKKLVKFSTLLGVVALVASPAKNITFQWPDSSHYWRVLINVNQYIDSYLKNHPQYFAKDKLVTDLSVIDIPAGGREAAAKQYKSVRKKLEARGMAVGTYVSGSTVIPETEQNHYPPANVSIEQMPPNSKYAGSWPGHTTRRIVDIADADTRHALQAGIRQLWENVPAPLRFVDNVPAHRKVSSSTPPWEATCKHIEELRKIAESLGSRVVLNIPMHVGELSDQEARQLMEAVGQNGIALEMPWSEGIRKSNEATKRAANRYRQFLDSGMAIILIAVKTPEGQLTAWVGSWRKPTDHIYIASPFFKQPDMSLYMLQ